MKETRSGRRLVKVTTHSRLLTTSSLSDLGRRIGASPDSITLLTLQQFKTEEEFRKKAGAFFEGVKSPNQLSRKILIAQIEAGTSTAGNLVECAKYYLQEMVNTTDRNSQFDVFLVVQVPRIAGGCYAGYPGEPWTSVHIDELRSPENTRPMPLRMMKDRSVYDLSLIHI